MNNYQQYQQQNRNGPPQQPSSYTSQQQQPTSYISQQQQQQHVSYQSSPSLSSKSFNRPKITSEIREFESSGVSHNKRKLETLADFFAIIKTTEALETAYSRDAITPSEYANECMKLISHFKNTESVLCSSGGK
jgi:hypothetical protein